MSPGSIPIGTLPHPRSNGSKPLCLRLDRQGGSAPMFAFDRRRRPSGSSDQSINDKRLTSIFWSNPAGCTSPSERDEGSSEGAAGDLDAPCFIWRKIATADPCRCTRSPPLRGFETGVGESRPPLLPERSPAIGVQRRGSGRTTVACRRLQSRGSLLNVPPGKAASALSTLDQTSDFLPMDRLSGRPRCSRSWFMWLRRLMRCHRPCLHRQG